MNGVSKWKIAMVSILAMVFGQGLFAQTFSTSNGGGAALASPTLAQAISASSTPMEGPSSHLPFEYGAIVQGGVGLTEDRDSFKFLMVGVHAGKVLYRRDKPGLLHGNFEYAAELFPFWQSYTPKFQRANCITDPNGSDGIVCSSLYNTGGTYTGITVTPIILRWNFTGGKRFVPWAQAAGGLLWTNHKYPAFGSPILSLPADGPNSEASVWNFTPQGGVGVHYFVRPNRSIDFGANGVHISSASLGDRNPGVNASVQFTVGYTFWK